MQLPITTPLGPGGLEGKHWEQQRLSEASGQQGGADTVTVELTVHFPGGLVINNGRSTAENALKVEM